MPSLTETLFSLGVGSRLVGITTFCVFPENEILGIPRVGGTKNPRIDAIRALGPDLVHMNLEENLEEHAREISGFATVFVSEPKSVADVDALLEDLGALHDAQDAARSLRSSLASSLSRARDGARKFRFAVPVWKSPWMWCGGDTYVSDLVAQAGGVNVLASAKRYPAIELVDVLRLKPDVVFLPDEPWRFVEEDAVSLRDRGVKVIGPFPGDLFTWHGSRTVLGLEFLASEL